MNQKHCCIINCPQCVVFTVCNISLRVGWLKAHNPLSVHTSGPHVPDRERFIAEILIDQQHPPLALSDIISLPPPCFAQLSSFAPQDPSDVWHMSDRGRLLSGLIREEQSTWRGTCEPFPRPSPPLKAPSAGQSIAGLTTGRPWKCFSPICLGLAKPSSLPPPLPWLSPGWQEPRWNAAPRKWLDRSPTPCWTPPFTGSFPTSASTTASTLSPELQAQSSASKEVLSSIFIQYCNRLLLILPFFIRLIALYYPQVISQPSAYLTYQVRLRCT